MSSDVPESSLSSMWPSTTPRVQQATSIFLTLIQNQELPRPIRPENRIDELQRRPNEESGDGEPYGDFLEPRGRQPNTHDARSNEQDVDLLPNQPHDEGSSESSQSSMQQVNPRPTELAEQEVRGDSYISDIYKVSQEEQEKIDAAKCEYDCRRVSIIILAITFATVTIIHLFTEVKANDLIGNHFTLNIVCVFIIALTPISLLIISFFVSYCEWKRSSVERPVHSTNFVGGLTLGLAATPFLTNSTLPTNIVLATACLVLIILRILIIQRLSAFLYQFIDCCQKKFPMCTCKRSTCRWCKHSILDCCSDEQLVDGQPEIHNS